MYSFAKRPERRLYDGEHHEAWLWVWQGGISFQCDAVDLGRRAISHPVDRLSATIFIAQQMCKHYTAMFYGLYSVTEMLLLNVGLVASLACFNQSCMAVRQQSLRRYLFWHSAWHFSLPGMIIAVCIARFDLHT